MTYIGSRLRVTQPATPDNTRDDGDDWTRDALCLQVDPEMFFPQRGGSNREAKAVCARCEAATACLEDALAADDGYGVRGGLSPRERRRVARAREAGAA